MPKKPLTKFALPEHAQCEPVECRYRNRGCTSQLKNAQSECSHASRNCKFRPSSTVVQRVPKAAQVPRRPRQPSQSCGQAPPNDEQLQELSQVSRRRKGSTHWEAYAKLLDEKRAASTGLLGLFPVGLAVGETVILLGILLGMERGCQQNDSLANG